MWLLLPCSGSASLEARPTTMTSLKHIGTSKRWVHAVQTTDASDSLEIFVPPGRRVITPAGARTHHSQRRAPNHGARLCTGPCWPPHCTRATHALHAPPTLRR